jgi:L-rhamnose isomerase
VNANGIEKAMDAARERYAALGVNVDRALAALARVSLSLQCWQGDDVGGFEARGAALGGGLAVTGNYPGKARDLDELRADLGAALALIPGRHRVNLHAMYGDFGGKPVERDQIEPKHFRSWVDWARERKLGLDFNATCFAHPLAAGGFTIASRDARVRAFWVEHVRRCREIGAWMGKKLGKACVHNLWVPDGAKDATVDRARYRERLAASLNAIYETAYPRKELLDSVEAKLFGIGSESFVVGSHEFYLGWAITHKMLLCLDMGHFHPNESVADKISAILPYVDELLLHVSRGVRWDSDHVVLQNDALVELMQEVVRAGALGRVRFALDYFDAELNRVGAWVIGARATLRTLLFALLEPTPLLRQYEERGDKFSQLALTEEAKSLPFGAVWDYHCLKMGVPAGPAWVEAVHEYEARVQSTRN